MWFNELRATNIAKDQGRAQRFSVSGQASNLASYNRTWDGESADFLRVGQALGSGNHTGNLSLGTTFNLHRFFEATGIVLPVTFGFSQNSSRPRFNAGDDVVKSGEQAAASETFGDSRSWSANYSRSWSERSNPLLRYTVGGITASASQSNAHAHDPNSLSQRIQSSGEVSYQIAPRRLLAIPVPWTPVKFQPLPERLYWNYSVANSRSEVSDRLRNLIDPLRDSIRVRDPVVGRAASIRFGADTRPIEAFNHHFEGVRNLMLEGSPRHLGFIHLGRVVNWRQTMGTQYTLNRGAWINPTVNWNSRYSQDNGPQLSTDLTVRQVDNGQSLAMNWNLPFDRL